MSSSGPKTVPTKASVKDFIAAQPDAQRRADCLALLELMQAATGEKAVMWGSAIIGFGIYRVPYANGSTGDWPVVAFSPRKHDLTLYITPGLDGHKTLLAKLGKHKTGKVCLYLKHLSDADPAVLKSIIETSVAAMAPQRVTLGKTT